MMEEKVHETSWYAFVLHWLQETYHIRLSSISRDDICVCTLLADYQPVHPYLFRILRPLRKLIRIKTASTEKKS